MTDLPTPTAEPEDEPSHPDVIEGEVEDEDAEGYEEEEDDEYDEEDEDE